MSRRIVNVAQDFSRYPAGRYENDGPFSGEAFRDTYLLPTLRAEEELTIQLDGVRGYGSSFLEEAFGGLVRHGLSQEKIKQLLELQSNDPSLIKEIKYYIQHGSEEPTNSD